ncbi:MAG: hypothetical protein AB1578_12475 [Thermodesulfobacteriota bacterium]
MPVYLCRWPNGDVSLVEAQDPEEASILLDEVGNADEAELHHLADLLVSFRLDDEGSLQVDQWGEACRKEVYEVAYPALEAARDAAFHGGWEPGHRPIPEPLRAAVEHERARGLEGGEGERHEARTELGRELQGLMGAPSALVDRLVELEGERVLKRAKPKGPKQ